MMRNRKPLVVANWKMHLTVAQALSLVRRLDVKIPDGSGVEIVLCSPTIALQSLKDEIKQLTASSKLRLGAQTVNEHDEGAFTGEVSAAQLRPLVDMALCGHSERRMYVGEKSDAVGRKVAACVRNGIVPILCVGENLHQRESGHGRRTVVDQLTAGLGHLTKKEVGQVVVAYEPVWAISTTKQSRHADPVAVEKMLGIIRDYLEEIYGETIGAHMYIIYGGSVEPDNTAAYLVLEDCDGVLVGSASLNWAEFSAIVQKASATIK